MAALLGRVHLGGDAFAVRADAWHGDRHAAYALTGREQSRVTGLAAAYVIRELLTGTVPPGVHHLEQLAGLARLPDDLAEHGVTLLCRSGRTARR